MKKRNRGKGQLGDAEEKGERKKGTNEKGKRKTEKRNRGKVR